MLNSHMHFIDLREIVQFVKASTFSGPRKNVLFLWIEVTRLFIWGIKYTKIMCTFSGTKFCVSWMKVSQKRMINYTVCSIKPTWMRLLAYILHGVMAQQNFDSFFKCNIQFIKTYKIFLSWNNISAVNTLGRWHFQIKRDTPNCNKWKNAK